MESTIFLIKMIRRLRLYGGIDEITFELARLAIELDNSEKAAIWGILFLLVTIVLFIVVKYLLAGEKGKNHSISLAFKCDFKFIKQPEENEPLLATNDNNKNSEEGQAQKG